MSAILIHFIGFALLDKLIPAWAAEVESGFACIWYASFALIDVMALSCTTSRWIKCILSISCAWSATLSVETLLMQDLLQGYDDIAQWLIDVPLIACAAGLLILWIDQILKRKQITEAK